jgi:hypothetical protein
MPHPFNVYGSATPAADSLMDDEAAVFRSQPRAPSEAGAPRTSVAHAAIFPFASTLPLSDCDDVNPRGMRHHSSAKSCRPQL